MPGQALHGTGLLLAELTGIWRVAHEAICSPKYIVEMLSFFVGCRYGVGQIYFRQEKYEMAEYHFRRSLLINQRSSVLRCYVGVALHKIGRPQDALEQLQVSRPAICAMPQFLS